MMNCPSDERLAAFIDGRLEGAARDEVVAHLSNCSDCRDVLNTAHEMPAEAEAPPRRSWIPAAALAAAAAVAAAIFLGPVADGFRMSRNMTALTAATAKLKSRPIQARPSIDIAYKRYPVNRGEDDRETNDPDLLEAASRIAGIAEKNPTAANLHKAGVAFLLAGYEQEAVQSLEAAAKEKADDADLLNDLAAAYHDAGDATRARETIERAWSLKKSAPIAWTRAVILWTAGAWNDYLKIDAGSEWSAEARETLALIGN